MDDLKIQNMLSELPEGKPIVFNYIRFREFVLELVAAYRRERDKNINGGAVSESEIHKDLFPINGEKPVTWEMIAEKLDKELQGIKSHAPSDADPSLLSYFRVSTAYIHRHLKEHKVPDDLYEVVYRHDKILGHIAHHWMDEASLRGGDTRDKESVAAVSVKNWLEQLRHEEQKISSKTPHCIVK